MKLIIDPGLELLNSFLEELREILSDKHTHLLELFEAFAEEARFGRRWLSASLARLPRRARVLEVGGGLMLLSTGLQREGFDVIALDPIGTGFSAFTELQTIVLAHADKRGWAPTVLRQRAEELTDTDEYDFAFSVNVMEHVDDVDCTIKRVVAALKDSANYRFTCPNYLFPYEPHFNIPTLFSKRLTAHVMGSCIFDSARVTDPAGMWASLNWITVHQVRRTVGTIPMARVKFHREIMSTTFERVVYDKKFAARRSQWLRRLVTLFVFTRLHLVLDMLPASLLPIIDCTVLKGRS